MGCGNIKKFYVFLCFFFLSFLFLDTFRLIAFLSLSPSLSLGIFVRPSSIQYALCELQFVPEEGVFESYVI